MKILSSDEKARLLDGFSNMRKYYLIPIILLIGVFFLINEFFPELHFYTFIIYLILLIIFIIITSIITFKKLILLKLPNAYIKKFTCSRILQYAGIVILFSSIIIDVFKKYN